MSRLSWAFGSTVQPVNTVPPGASPTPSITPTGLFGPMGKSPSSAASAAGSRRTAPGRPSMATPLLCKSAFMSGDVVPGADDASNAAMPETSGAAAEVPENASTSPPTTGAGRSMPGANTSTHGPKSENDATEWSRVLAPTATTPGYRAG